MTVAVICTLFLLISSCTIIIKNTTFTVRFYVQDELISTQKVQNNSAAIAPEVPEIEGYVFLGWDREFSRVTRNINVHAILVEVPDNDLDKLKLDLEALQKELKDKDLKDIKKLPMEGKYFGSTIQWTSDSTKVNILNDGSIEIINYNENNIYLSAILSINNSVLYIEFVL